VERMSYEALALSRQPRYTGHIINALLCITKISLLLTTPQPSFPSAGEAYYRTKQWGPALKKFYAIQRHFQDYIDDMSDFHGFCLRKVSFSGVQIYDFVCGIKETMLCRPCIPFDRLRDSYPYC
jgi:NMDA receptor-regulated protein 1